MIRGSLLALALLACTPAAWAQEAAPAAATAPTAATSARADGAAVFQANCAVCHGPKGLGQPSLAPPLTSYPGRYAGLPDGRRQLAATVLYGMFGRIDVEGKHFDFKMPEFGQLDDAALAAVLNFVVFEVAKAPAATPALTPEEIKAVRATPMSGAEVREQRTKVLSLLGL